MKYFKISLLLVCIFISGCSQESSIIELPSHLKDLENLTVYSAAAEPSYDIQFEQEQNFGDTNEAYIGRLWKMDVDNAGRVYIADADQLDIKVYEPDGRFLTRLGRQGRGPGEFLEISDIQAATGRLVVFDRNQQQGIIFFTDSLVYSHTIPLAENRSDFNELRDAYLSRYHLRENNTFLMSFSKADIPEKIDDWGKIENSVLYYLLDETGKIASDKLFERKSTIEVLVPFPGRRTGMPVKFYGELLRVLSNDDRFFLAWSEDFLIMRYNLTGEYEGAFYYPFQRTSLIPESVLPAAEGTDFHREAIQSLDLPETWPALESMLIDDENRLWISTIVDDDRIYEWWVLEDSGELITKFNWPRDEPIEKIKNGYLYTRETDGETDLQQIVRYRIEFI